MDLSLAVLSARIERSASLLRANNSSSLAAFAPLCDAAKIKTKENMRTDKIRISLFLWFVTSVRVEFCILLVFVVGSIGENPTSASIPASSVKRNYPITKVVLYFANCID